MARARARVLKGTTAGRWSAAAIVWVAMLIVPAELGAPTWLRVASIAPLVVATWATVRYVGDGMRQGATVATRLAVFASAIVVFVIAALVLGLRGWAPGQFAQGVFTVPGETLSAFGDLPTGYEWLSVFVVGPWMLVLNASGLGFWLRERPLRPAVLRWIVRWVVLYLAAVVLFATVVSFAVTMREHGASVWTAPAVLMVVPLAIRMLLAATEIRRSRAAAEGPFAWEPPSPDRGPRLLTGRHRVRVAALVLVSICLGASGLMLVRAPIDEPAAAAAATTPEVAMSVLLSTTLIGWLMLYAAVAVYLRARRWASPRAEDLPDGDRILYLRSFGDDDVRVWAHTSRRQAYVERLLGRCTERFEVVLGWHLRSFGPVTAVGRPTERLPRLGAAREYLDDHTWQKEIESRITHARAVVVVLGRTAGLTWEMQALERLGATTRALIVVPPVSREELADRWNGFEQMAEQLGWPVPDAAERSRMLVGRLDEDRAWTVIAGRRRDEYEYEVALETGIALINSD